MRDSVLAIIGGTVVAVLIAITLALSVGVDNDAPVISFESEISYNDRQPIAALLEGVTAYDTKDGDVTESIMVESLIVLDGGGQAKVTYTAKDDSNNIAKASRIIAYSGSGESIYASSTVVISNEDISSDIQNTTEEPTTQEPETTTPEETTTEPETTTPEETTTAEPETTTPAQTVAAGGEAPVLTMSVSEGNINVGGFFNVASYVSDITDNNDTREELYRRIGIEGNYDSYAPGDYTFYVYCIDSDRNISNKERFVLHVVY